MMGWLAKARKGSRMVLQSCSRAGMNCEGTVLSMWLAKAVALLSNSATVKYGVNLKIFIRYKYSSTLSSGFRKRFCE